MNNSVLSSSTALQDYPFDLYMLAETPVEKQSFVFVALSALRAVKSKKYRPHELEPSSALIVGDALLTLRALQSSESYKSFL